MRNLAAAVILFAMPAASQDAAEILRKVEETYRSLKSNEFEHVERKQSVTGETRHEAAGASPLVRSGGLPGMRRLQAEGTRASE